MDRIAIIAEYNPFHKGHKYQINEIKKERDNCSVISIMSPNFVQRGYPAVFDKYLRGECAVKSGVDLAVSMPIVFAILSAEGFAEAGVKLANKFGATHLSFGVETLDKSLLIDVANFLISSDFEAYIKEELASSPYLSYPAVREKAIEKALSKNAATFIKTPNNILAVEYVKAILRFCPNIEILPIKRTGNAYDDKSSDGDILSATAIRHLMAEKQSFYDKIPKETIDTVINANEFNTQHFESFLYSVIFTKAKEDILKCSGNVELSDIIYKSAQKHPDFESFRSSLSRRKHTEAKIDRALLNIMLNIGYDEYFHQDPKYATVLAMNSKGKEIISSLRKSNDIVLISKGSDFKKHNLEGMDVEIFADRIYGRCTQTPSDGGYFLRKKPYIYEE